MFKLSARIWHTLGTQFRKLSYQFVYIILFHFFVGVLWVRAEKKYKKSIDM